MGEEPVCGDADDAAYSDGWAFVAADGLINGSGIHSEHLRCFNHSECLAIQVSLCCHDLLRTDRGTAHNERIYVLDDTPDPQNEQEVRNNVRECMTSAHNDATLEHMASEDVRVGPAGEVLAANIKRVREARRLGYAEFSRQLTGIGRPIPELGLRRIELGERRVDADDLLALSYVLQVAVVDLLVPKDMNDEPYPITPDESFKADSVRDWIAGQDIRLDPIQTLTRSSRRLARGCGRRSNRCHRSVAVR